MKSLIVILFFPCLLAPPALPTGYRYGQQGCQLLSNRRVERCHVCILHATNNESCHWLEFLLPPATTTVATTTVAPTQKPCSDTYAFPEMVCGVNTDGSVGSCIGYDLSVSTAVILAPLCLVNGRLPRNCRLNSELAAVACRTHDWWPRIAQFERRMKTILIPWKCHGMHDCVRLEVVMPRKMFYDFKVSCTFDVFDLCSSYLYMLCIPIA